MDRQEIIEELGEEIAPVISSADGVKYQDIEDYRKIAYRMIASEVLNKILSHKNVAIVNREADRRLNWGMGGITLTDDWLQEIK